MADPPYTSARSDVPGDSLPSSAAVVTMLIIVGTSGRTVAPWARTARSVSPGSKPRSTTCVAPRGRQAAAT